ncbi:hypothetical protein D3C59_37070 [Streptomyces sp. SHP22-7]|nr:hypothetical protein D3C59_37070 [Streptomyces sp. SHP22-7]
MTDRLALEDLDATPDDGRGAATAAAEDCALCTDPNPNYPFICTGHERTTANERIVGEAAQAADPRPFGERHGPTPQEVASSLYTVGSPAFTAMTVPPSQIVIDGAHGPLVTIHLTDGRLEYGPGYTPDEAARRFWDAVRKHMPELREKN